MHATLKSREEKIVLRCTRLFVGIQRSELLRLVPIEAAQACDECSKALNVINEDKFYIDLLFMLFVDETNYTH